MSDKQPESSKDWVQCFFNFTYNHGDYQGQLKFCYGFAYLKLCGDCDSVKDQLLRAGKLDEMEVLNFNLTSLTPFHKDVFTDYKGGNK